METRRRRNTAFRGRNYYTSRTYSRRREETGGGLFSIVLLLIMTAALVYILVATPVGNWLVGSVFKFGKEPSSSGERISAPTALPSSSNTASPFATDTETKKFELKPLELYALQIGIFDTAEGAKTLASTLKSLGAAGYLFSTAEGERVLASGYLTEAAASSVSKRLNEQGYASTVYPIRTQSVALSCTSTEDRLEKVGSACAFASEIITKLYEESIRFDGEERGVDYGIAVVRELTDKVRDARSSLDGISDSGGVINCLDEYYLQLTGALTRLGSSDTTNRVEFSGRLKYLQLEAVDHYRALIAAVEAHKSE